MPANTTELEKRLWGAADELRANSKLKSSEYSVPVLGLIFLRYADNKFAKARLQHQGSTSKNKLIPRITIDFVASLLYRAAHGPEI